MAHHFEPFTPDEFKKSTGREAFENEGIYLRWVNSQVNYANYKNIQEMTESLKQICSILNEQPFTLEKNK